MTTGKKYAYFSHRECEFFPCHPGADPDNFNCLFCYCPLYLLGAGCGGSFIIQPDGRKDCSNCLYPHRRESYEEIVRRYGEIEKALFDLRTAPVRHAEETSPARKPPRRK